MCQSDHIVNTKTKYMLHGTTAPSCVLLPKTTARSHQQGALRGALPQRLLANLFSSSPAVDAFSSGCRLFVKQVQCLASPGDIWNLCPSLSYRRAQCKPLADTDACTRPLRRQLSMNEIMLFIPKMEACTARLSVAETLR